VTDLKIDLNKWLRCSCHDEPIAKLGCVLAMRTYEVLSRLLCVPSCDVLSLSTRSKCS
jgi:hypothetical protein